MLPRFGTFISNNYTEAINTLVEKYISVSNFSMENCFFLAAESVHSGS
jgi:hypothetical protein